MNQLSEIYPEEDVSTLMKVINDAQGDFEQACMLLAEQKYEQPVEEPIDDTDMAFHQVKAMFPECKDAEIRDALNSGKDLEDTINILLTLITLETLPAEERQLNIHHPLLTQETPEPPKKPADWNSILIKAEKVASALGIEKNSAISLLHTYNGDVSKAIVIHVRQETAKLEPEEAATGLGLSLKRLSIGGRRVQNGNPAQYSSSTPASPSWPAKVELKTDDLVALQAFLDINPEFSKISRDFYINALKYFNKDLGKVAVAASLIMEEKNWKVTFPDDTNKKLEQKSAEQKKAEQKKADHKITLELFQFAPRKTQEDVPPKVTPKPPAEPLTFFSTQPTVVDLHGLTVDEALQETISVLDQWWAYELKQREFYGKFINESKAKNVQAVTIITGRGIHTIGGFSPIRRKVIKYLDSQGYRFELDTGSVKVFGRHIRLGW